MNIISITSSDQESVAPLLKDVYIPPKHSHKGNNGKALIIGGSSLFHSASLWSAEIASHFLDMVHYASTQENNEIMLNLKTLFRNGIVVPQKEIPLYVEEDDVVLIGPGMVRSRINNEKLIVHNYADILKIENEGEYARELTRYLLTHYPKKRFVIDAGALQMIDADWLTLLHESPIITPHIGEFERLFQTSLASLSPKEIAQMVQQKAKQYSCIIMLTAITDYISNGEEVYSVNGGNQGLTKGGSGDILAGLTASLYARSSSLASAISASYIVKTAADELYKEKGYWYNMKDIIETIPKVSKLSLL